MIRARPVGYLDSDFTPRLDLSRSALPTKSLCIICITASEPHLIPSDNIRRERDYDAKTDYGVRICAMHDNLSCGGQDAQPESSTNPARDAGKEEE